MRKIVLVTLFSVVLVCSADFNQERSCQINQDNCCSEENFLDGHLLSKPTFTSEQLFRAAVVEHQVVNTSNVIESVDANLAIYKKIAEKAAENGVNVLVFPEDGLFLPAQPDGALETVLTSIPDPHLLLSNESNPCQQPTFFEPSYILRNLSCIARENNLYLIANFGTKQDCQPGAQVGNQKCPLRGYFALNTNVVIDPRGNFIERYRKYNMFLEVFDKATSLETVFFDTPYGRFGIFICFDMLFMRPAIELVEKYHIDTAIFPTLWYDELPILTALQFQEGWSWTNKVNLLASNIHRLESGSTGSGIYSGYNFLYTSSDAQNPRLLIANVPISASASKCNSNFDRKIIDLDKNQEVKPYKHLHYNLTSDDHVHVLKKMEDKQTICQPSQFCCTIDYKIVPNFSDTILSGKLIVIVRDGVREGIFNWYEQVCTLATLESPFDEDNLSKNRFSTQGLVGFERLTLEGKFTTKYVYPIAAYSVTDLVERYRKEFYCDQLDDKREKFSCQLNLSNKSREKEVYSFGLYGRAYDCDRMPEWWTKGGAQPSFAKQVGELRQQLDSNQPPEHVTNGFTSNKIFITSSIRLPYILSLLIICICIIFVII